VQAWGDHIIGRLRPKAKALFQAGRFIGVDGDRALFGLPNEIHRDRCEEIRGEIEAVLSDHFGRPVPLVLVVEAAPAGGPGVEAHAPPGPPSTPAAAATVAVDGDPLPGPRRHATPAADAGGAADLSRPDDDGADDLSAFDDAELGEVVDVDNSAEARVLQAFPGAEEVG
jgi:DNA polymerase-3 subunit gamma/tau